MREDYDRKMRALVSDTTTYENVKTDPTARYQNGNNSIVRRLKDLKLIDHRTAKELSSTNATCPRIYGQPKAHKPDLPLRPVIPNITAPTYKLAKYIADILQNSFHSQYSTTSSFEFCGDVNQVVLPEGYIMISLDVTSLFTNVPRHLVIRSIINRWNEVKTQINLDLFLEIVEYCMEASYFCFEGRYFKQTYGTAMGSPLSPIVADIVLDSVIKTAMNSLPFEITIFRKYVDNIFMAIPRECVQQVLDAFNRIEPRLQFTTEEEKENRLPFLDMTVIRNADQTLTTEWYAKPIASGRMLNYNSFHQPKYKINVANNFIHRVCSLTRNKPLDEIAKTIHQHLRQNNYPKSLINRLLHFNISRLKPSLIPLRNYRQPYQPSARSTTNFCIQHPADHPASHLPYHPQQHQTQTTLPISSKANHHVSHPPSQSSQHQMTCNISNHSMIPRAIEATISKYTQSPTITEQPTASSIKKPYVHPTNLKQQGMKKCTGRFRTYLHSRNA
ncbi:uncharacterized protein LOC134288705 [Aedes albopictus]|uniref:Reverse transcriptase domain-containing protein n=1 Tax=Aedes albopictus TaxID=7160 RepID=A0ABM1XLC7_AEDAL